MSAEGQGTNCPIGFGPCKWTNARCEKCGLAWGPCPASVQCQGAQAPKVGQALLAFGLYAVGIGLLFIAAIALGSSI
jgi:hypothetical protein